uniref:SGNH hydrolase-type esterase domain-containing protein n=1 Tax=Timspurckia oligopyrenoides TaxID=708627 RepID=A0A7S1EQN7_9RHOD|mmetsp:Transcript_12616/g.22751  ORF Transcript_12616/g.22751 Transcript_12616/m.22751 type:complete len:467 (+) Transcript_12616:68-1468(+)
MNGGSNRNDLQEDGGHYGSVSTFVESRNDAWIMRDTRNRFFHSISYQNQSSIFGIALVLSFVLISIILISSSTLSESSKIQHQPLERPIETMETSNRTVINATNPLVVVHGRARNTTDGYRFDWAATTFQFTVINTTLVEILLDGGKSTYSVTVFDQDGTEVQKSMFRTDNDKLSVYKLIENLIRSKPYTIQLMRLLEPSYIQVFDVGLGPATFAKILLDKEFSGALVKVNQNKEEANFYGVKKLQVVGDSYAVGVCSLGLPQWTVEDVKENIFTASNVEYGWPYLFAKDVHLELDLVASSSRGIVIDQFHSGSETMIKMLERTVLADGLEEFNKWNYTASQKADLVLIVLGSNDFSVRPYVSTPAFLAAYQEFLEKVISLNSLQSRSSRVVSICGGGNPADSERPCNYVKYVAKQLNTTYIHLNSDLITFPANEGCLQHYNTLGQKIFASAIKESLSDLFRDKKI